MERLKITYDTIGELNYLLDRYYNLLSHEEIVMINKTLLNGYTTETEMELMYKVYGELNMRIKGNEENR